MNLINTFHRLKIRFLEKLPNDNFYIKPVIFFSLLTIIASIIWFIGPSLVWGDYQPFAQPEERIYVILFLYLVWLLKFLLIDLDAPLPFSDNNPQTQKKLQDLKKRFYGALKFLKKTTITKHGKEIYLNELPWYLLLGPLNAGKTSLLANSTINFILQRQFQHQEINHIENSDCDWWVTRDATIIDIPGKYLLSNFLKKTPPQPVYPALWQCFLRLIKKERGKQGLNGIIIALPLPEIIKQTDPKKYQALLRNLFQRLYEIQKIFQQRIPCQLIITKCDLIPGFSEFFSELTDEDITQAWGVKFNMSKEKHDFEDQFNTLIKKLNQQLIFRLHQERNPLARPYIKDFPIQLERIKQFTQDFIKQFSATRLTLSLQGVYLTSALQKNVETDATIIDEISNTTQQAIKIFKEPPCASRAYFIKQLIAYGLVSPIEKHHPNPQIANWKKYAVYISSASAILISIYIFGRDFEQGIKQTYSIQNVISEYQQEARETHDPDIRLQKAFILLDILNQSTKSSPLQLQFNHLISFYSHRSQEKIGIIYQQALQFILIPEIKNYLEEYLKLPVNKNTENVFKVLKAYLMLGDATHFNASVIIETMKEILPKSATKNEIDSLLTHITLALNTAWQPLKLNDDTITQTRKYLSAIPSLQIAYIILKNLDDNDINNKIDLLTPTESMPVFIPNHLRSQIPIMFTAKAFPVIFNQEAAKAAEEAVAGNWVLGNNFSTKNTADTALATQLRTSYINNYINAWENSLFNINLLTPKDLAQVDSMIVNIISNDSPLLSLLQTLHTNTYFEPLISASPKLLSLNLLIEKNNQADNLLYQIFVSLQFLHTYIQSVLTAENQKKAAFDLISNRVKNLGNADAITQLLIIASQSPEPIKSWLTKIANDSWRLLMKDAGYYINTAWQDQVIQPYEANIANRYPFADSEKEIELAKFTQFFGNPGIFLDFYKNYLQAFVDTSTPYWHWKTVDNIKLPLSENNLRQIQQALRIHKTFFQNGDNKLYVKKYLSMTDKTTNTFLSSSLHQFHLSSQMMDTTA